MADEKDSKKDMTIPELEELLGHTLGDGTTEFQLWKLNRDHEMERHGWSAELTPAETYVEEAPDPAEKDKPKGR